MQNSKVSSRRRPYYICAQFVKSGHNKLLEQELLDKCDERNVTWACFSSQSQVCGAYSDLHAADARYTQAAVSSTSPKYTSAALKVLQEGYEDESLQAVVRILKEDQSKMWNSIEFILKKEGVNCLIDCL